MNTTGTIEHGHRFRLPNFHLNLTNVRVIFTDIEAAAQVATAIKAEVAQLPNMKPRFRAPSDTRPEMQSLPTLKEAWLNGRRQRQNKAN